MTYLFSGAFYIKKKEACIMDKKLKNLVSIAMLCALAYSVTVLSQLIPISVAGFLDYDPKDIVIAIGGFIFGPMSAFVISAIVSLLEMVTISSTGYIGCIMNIISSCALVCTASYIYSKKRTMLGAVIGLITGVLLMTSFMLLWNYLITPLYMNQPRELVASMLIPVFLPFNLIKGGINISVTLMLYKPVVTALRRAGLISAPEKSSDEKNSKLGIMLVALLMLVTCVFFFLVLAKVI